MSGLRQETVNFSSLFSFLDVFLLKVIISISLSQISYRDMLPMWRISEKEMEFLISEGQLDFDMLVWQFLRLVNAISYWHHHHYSSWSFCFSCFHMTFHFAVNMHYHFAQLHLTFCRCGTSGWCQCKKVIEEWERSWWFLGCSRHSELKSCSSM